MSQATTTKIRRYPVLAAPLEAAPIPAEDIISGEPESRMAILWRSEDNKLYNGVWHCTPGVFMLTHPGETICLVEGRATITPEDGGEPVTVVPGEVVFLPEGLRARWEVHETVKKAFHSHDSTGMLLSGGVEA
ncbi:MAG: cupin domain-containing protein [Solirubrobacterales bacterium]